MGGNAIKRLGQGLSINSATKLRQITGALIELVRLTPQARTTPVLGSIAASQVVSGSMADGRIQQSNVTQHEEALAIGFDQLTGDPEDAALATSDGTTGGAASAGAGKQYVELVIGGVTYKILHDGTV